MNHKIKQTIEAIREAEQAFAINESNQHTGKWTKLNRSHEISRALILLRRDLTELVEQELMLCTLQKTIKAA